MINPGVGGWDIKYYYSTNHINVWTRKHIEGLLKKCGFTIIKEDHVIYGDTYLCKKGEIIKDIDSYFENPSQVKQWLDNIKTASECFDKQEYEKAINIWPDFPYAHRGFYEKNRAKFHKDGFEEIEKDILQQTLKMCPDSTEALLLVADIYMRYDKFDKAIEMLDQAERTDPNSALILHLMSICYRNMAAHETDIREKYNMISRSSQITDFLRNSNLQAAPEAYNWLMHDFSQLPMPDKKPKKK
jgi:tetratricopeptide (TPR) repeat protein